MKNNLEEYRKQIDSVDTHIIKLLQKRMKLVKQVGEYKKINNILPLDATRWAQVLQTTITLGQQYGVSKRLITQIYEAIHSEALQIEENIKNDK